MGEELANIFFFYDFGRSVLKGETLQNKACFQLGSPSRKHTKGNTFRHLIA